MKVNLQWLVRSSLICIVGIHAQAQELVKAPIPQRTEASKRLDYKKPLPTLPSRTDLARANGEIRVEVLVEKDGNVESFSLTSGSLKLFNVFKGMIREIKFQPSSKSDHGPWIVDLYLFSKSLSPNPAMRDFKHQLSVAILDVQDPVEKK